MDQKLCPCSLTPPSSCRALSCPIKPQPHLGSTSGMTLRPFQGPLPHHSQVFNSSSSKPKLSDGVKKRPQQTSGISPEAGKGQPTLTLHGTASWGRLRPSLALPAPPGEAPQPHLPPAIPSKQQHLPAPALRGFSLMKS